MSSRSFGSRVVHSPSASNEKDAIRAQGRVSVTLETKSDDDQPTVLRPPTRTISSAMSSNSAVDDPNVVGHSLSSCTLNEDLPKSKDRETSSTKNRTDREQSKQTQLPRSSFTKSKSQTEKQIKASSSGALKRSKDVEVAPPNKEDIQQKGQRATRDIDPLVSKLRKKQASSPIPSPQNVDSKVVKGRNSSSNVLRQSSSDKISGSEAGKPILSSSSKLSLSDERKNQPREHSQRKMQSLLKVSNAGSGREIQYPITPKSNNYDNFGKQSSTPSSSNDSRESARTPLTSSDSRVSPPTDDRPRILSTRKKTKTLSSQAEESPHSSDKKAKMQSSQGSSQPSTPSISSNSRSSSRTDDSPNCFSHTTSVSTDNVACIAKTKVTSENKSSTPTSRLKKEESKGRLKSSNGPSSRISNGKDKVIASEELGRQQSGSNLNSRNSLPLDTKPLQRDGSGKLRVQQRELHREKKSAVKVPVQSRARGDSTSDLPLKPSSSMTTFTRDHSSDRPDPSVVQTTMPGKQGRRATVASSTINPPTKQSSGRSNSSGGPKRKSDSRRRISVKQTTETGNSSSSGSALDARLNGNDRKQTDEISVASDPSLPDEHADFVKLRTAVLTRKSFNNRNKTEAPGAEVSDRIQGERSSGTCSGSASIAGGEPKAVRRASSNKLSSRNGRHSNRTLDDANGSSHRRLEASNKTEAERVNEKSHTKPSGAVRKENGGGASRGGKPKDSTALSTYLSDISVSTAEISVSSVHDSRWKVLGSSTEKLKTSHLRRLVEPLPRREHVARNSSHSSSALSSSGIRSSSSDHTEAAMEDRSIGTDSLCLSSSKASNHRSRLTQRNASFYRPKMCDSNVLTGAIKGDAAPITPLRRLSMTGHYERQYSIASSSRCSYSGEESELDAADMSYSERIEEENEEGEESTTTSLSYANSTLSSSMMKPLDFDDVFTQFTWSISHQDPQRIQKARQGLRDSIIDTPLFRAMESHRRQNAQPPVHGINENAEP